jgi:predicted nucleic acid-binding protein
MVMKIYLDACCLNRLTDDQTQLRIRQEAEAVEQILRRMRAGEIQWISSEVLVDEIDRNSNVERRLENPALLTLASESLEVDAVIASRAADLQIAGYGAYDALHLACAEAARVDVLLTTDDGFIRKASRRDGKPLVAVRNPLFWSKGNLP